MKLNIVHNAKGKILAAVQIDPDPSAPQLRPVPGRGHSSIEIEMSEQHAAMDFQTLCLTYKVDKKKKILVGPKKR